MRNTDEIMHNGKTLTEVLRLHKCWLSGSRGERANLKSANLESANLEFANLKFANLEFANLKSANLKSANLKFANLESANLEFANLESAHLEFANLESAKYKGIKIKKFRAFTGLYQYQVFAIVDENGISRVALGCKFQKVEEWKENFWNNTNEFPNDDSIKTKERQFALRVAIEWLEMHNA